MHFRNDEGMSTGATAGYFVDGKMDLRDGIFIDHFEYLKSVSGLTESPKLTIPSPTLIHFRSGREGIDKSAYPTMEKFFFDLASIYRKEIDLLVKLDVRMFKSTIRIGPIFATNRFVLRLRNCMGWRPKLWRSNMPS